MNPAKLTGWRFAGMHAQGLYDNDGSVVICYGNPMSDDSGPICRVSPHAKAKRGEAYKLIDPERDRIAALIAAAPDLLEALKVARECVEADIETGPMEDEASEHARKVLAQIDAAISRAEGKE